MLQMEKLELVDALLNLCSYRHPTDITLPKGLVEINGSLLPPKLFP